MDCLNFLIHFKAIEFLIDFCTNTFCVCTKYKISYMRKRAGIERELASTAVQRVLRWLGRVERMDEYRITRRASMAEVSGGRVRGRPRLSSMDGVKVALGNRGMTVEAARKTGKSGEPWYICNWTSFTRPFLLGPVIFRSALPSSGGHHMERGGMRLG